MSLNPRLAPRRICRLCGVAEWLMAGLIPEGAVAPTNGALSRVRIPLSHMRLKTPSELPG